MKHDAFLRLLREEKTVTKAGVALYGRLADMACRENSVILLHETDSHPDRDVTPYLLEHCGAEVEQGLALLAELAGGAEVIRCPRRQCASPALREPTALYSLLDKGCVRSDVARLGYTAAFPSCGYQGRPTLVVTAEDCRMVWQLHQGQPVEKAIVCVEGDDRRVLSLPVGTPLADVLATFDVPAKAVLLGGGTGRLVTPDEPFFVNFDYLFDSVETVPEGGCVAALLARLASENKGDSCQRCVLCREGTWQVERIFRDMLDGQAKSADLSELADLSRLVSLGSMCAFGQHALRPLGDALARFGGELEEHFLRGNCPSGVCFNTKTYQIDPYLCGGCTQCLDVCEYDAIDGKKGFIHVVDAKMCEQCGACAEECPEGAIKLGADLKVPTRPTKVGRFHD